MHRICSAMFAAALALAFALAARAANPAPPTPPSWGPILTRPGGLPLIKGHLQGFCVTSNAIYGTLQDGLYKYDWYGRLLKKAPASRHQGDICYWNGKLYTAVCSPTSNPRFGRIDVWNEELEKVNSTQFANRADGIACIDGVLYVGLGSASIPGKPDRGTYFGKFDAETLKPLCKPFMVDHGYKVFAGVQNIATDGKLLYMSFYTPNEDDPCFFVFDTDFKLLGAHVFGWRHGLDVVGGGEPGAVRFIYALTLNCWWRTVATRLPLDPAPSQLLFRYGELKDGKITDITQYISFRKEKKR